MPTIEDQVKTVLKDAGYSATAPRIAVFSALKDSPPQTMNQLVHSVSSSVNRASVYRTIDMFIKLHIVERISIGWKYKLELSDQFSHHHHHIICSLCGRIDELHENQAIESTLKQLSDSHGYSLSSHQIELRGICAACQL